MSVNLGLTATESNHLLYIDIDHLLRWVENDPSELEEIVERIPDADLTVIGRGPDSFKQLPERLAVTESIVNRIYELVTGNKWDVMMAARGMSRRAARLIVNLSNVDNIGNDVDWPLLCRSQGLNLRYEAANGLTYRTNRDYAEDLADELDKDPNAWALRVEIAAQHVNAIRPYMSEGHLT